MQIITSENHNELKNKQFNALTSGIYVFDTQSAIIENDFVVLGGSTGSGKSTIALFMACSIAKSGRKVLYINTENDETHLINEMIKLGFDYNKDFGEFNSHHHNRLIITCITALSFTELENMVTAIAPEVLFLDLFSVLLEGVPGFNIPNITLDYAKRFSFFKKNYNCTVFVTEQLVKDNKRYSRPTIDDIKGGAALGQKATKVMIVYRYCKDNIEKKYNSKDPMPKIVDYVTELIIRKDRYAKLSGIEFLKYQFGYQQLLTQELHQYCSYVFRSGK
jgi:energy-coupling factor transporter ATP-binding protein EcfA2